MKIAYLDALFREFIRKRAIKLAGGCEYCLSAKYDIEKSNGKILPAWKQLDTSHYWSRTNKSVRWDERNAAGICGNCHFFLEHNPLPHTQFFLKRLGKVEFELLEIQANQVIKKAEFDELAITLYLQSKIKELSDSL